MEDELVTLSPRMPKGGEEFYDVAIIGYGPAGASAALTLVRANRTVCLFDGEEAQDAGRRIRGALNVDGQELVAVKRAFREQLAQYPLVVHHEPVISVEKHRKELTVASSVRAVQCRKIIFATGLRQALPAIPGIQELYGVSVFHCAYCHGWEARGQRWALLGSGEAVIGLALVMQAWTHELALLTNGISLYDAKHVSLLEQAGIGLYEDEIARLESTNGKLAGVRFTSGRLILTDVLFVKPDVRQGTTLVYDVGCVDTLDELIPSRQMGQTRVPGVYAAGDCRLPLQQFSIASGDGVTVATGVNNDLALEPFRTT